MKLKDLHELKGCGSHSCRIKRPEKIGTNGPCTCFKGLSTAQRIEVEKRLKNDETKIKELGNIHKELDEKLERAEKLRKQLTDSVDTFRQEAVDLIEQLDEKWDVFGAGTKELIDLLFKKGMLSGCKFTVDDVPGVGLLELVGLDADIYGVNVIYKDLKTKENHNFNLKMLSKKYDRFHVIEETCKWDIDEYLNYDTSCEHRFFFDNDGPKENNFKYCPFCGKPIEVVETK